MTAHEMSLGAQQCVRQGCSEVPASSWGRAGPCLGMFLCLPALCGAFIVMPGALYFEDLKWRAYSLGQQLTGGSCCFGSLLFWRKILNSFSFLFFFPFPFVVNLHPQFRPIKARSLVTRAAQYRQQRLPPRTALRDHCTNRDPPRRGDTQIQSPPRPRKI